MFKRISIAFLALLIMSQTAFAAVSTPEEILGENAGITVDFSLKGRLKEALAPHLSKFSDPSIFGTDQQGRDKLLVIMNQILAGERVYVSLITPEQPLVVIKVSDDQWKTLITGATSQTHSGVLIYSYEDTFLARVSGMAILAPTLDDVKKTIDRAQANGIGSLAQSEYYRKLSTALIADRIIGVVLNWGKLKDLTKELGSNENIPGLDVDVTTILNRVIDIITHESYSVSETSTGYTFAGKILASEPKLREHGITLNATGNFVPYLYTKLPAQAPILYSEGYNLKASNENGNRFLNYILGSDGTEIHNEIAKEILTETGIDINAVMALFTRENAIAIQSSPDSLIPTFTLAANISETRLQAEPIIKSMISSLSAKLKKSLDAEDAPYVKIERASDGKSLKITIDPKMFDNELLAHEKPMVITMGLTSDDLFVVSNFSTILDPSTRRGFGNDSDFIAHPEVKTAVQSISYINARNTWKLIDRFFAQAALQSADERPSLATLKSYYNVASLLYRWKDAIIVTFSTSTDASLRGAITIDEAKHASYAEYLEKLVNTDSDSDLVNDFDEQYLYNTDSGDDDCDNNGQNDFEAMEVGFDPCNNAAPIFKDFAGAQKESAPYYIDEVVNLKRAGIVNGFPDGTFGAGKTMTRAEFIQMVVKAFHPSTFAMGSTKLPFDDVHAKDWFYDAVSDAYEAGYISANQGHFRPGDSITRAEALVILNHASKKLSSEMYSAQCENTFDDVNSGDWFCEAVSNGKRNGITSGRTKQEFAPQATLTRGEGAVMIRRSLEVDVQDAAGDTSNPYDIFGGF